MHVYFVNEKKKKNPDIKLKLNQTYQAASVHYHTIFVILTASLFFLIDNLLYFASN